MSDFRGEWARRVGERLLAGEGFDPEADKPTVPGYSFDTSTEFVTLHGVRPFESPRHFQSVPPVAEAVSDPDVEITVTPAQYEELITLRAQKDTQAELAMLRERRRALEVDVEEAYDKLEAESCAHAKTRSDLTLAHEKADFLVQNRDEWLDRSVADQLRAREAENQIGEFQASAEKARRLAILACSCSTGVAVTALWGHRIVEILAGLLP